MSWNMIGKKTTSVLPSVKESSKSTSQNTKMCIFHFNKSEAHTSPLCLGKRPREYSYYAQIWGEDYLRNIISKLQPELEGKIDNRMLNEINDRVFPEQANA